MIPKKVDLWSSTIWDFLGHYCFEQGTTMTLGESQTELSSVFSFSRNNDDDDDKDCVMMMSFTGWDFNRPVIDSTKTLLKPGKSQPVCQPTSAAATEAKWKENK